MMVGAKKNSIGQLFPDCSLKNIYIKTLMESNNNLKKIIFRYFDDIFGDFEYLENELPGWVGYYVKQNGEWLILVGAEKDSIGEWYWDGNSFSSVMELFSITSKELGLFLKEYLEIKKGETRIERIL